LALANDLLHQRRPAAIRPPRRQDALASTLARDVGRRLVMPAGLLRPPLNGTYGQIESALLYLRSRERWREKVVFAAEVARRFGRSCSLRPNARDVASVPLPRYASPLYYLVRPIRLAGKYGPRVFAQLRGTTCR
jgi:hypothetical protein